MTEQEAERRLALWRWPETNGEPVCPKCVSRDFYRIHRGRQFRCVGCKCDYTVMTGTVFAHRKKPLSFYVTAMETPTDNMLEFARALGIDQRTGFALAHKIRGLVGGGEHGQPTA